MIAVKGPAKSRFFFLHLSVNANRMKRRDFLRNTAVGASGLLIGSGKSLGHIGRNHKSRLVFIGTYTETPDQGILRYLFDPSDGSLTSAGPAIPAENPSFLARSHDGQFLFAVNETAVFNGNPGGYASSFRILNQKGDLQFLGSQPTLGAHPCQVTVSGDDRFILVSNYTGGNVTVLPVNGDGTLGNPVSMIQHHGSGPNSERQEKAHVHSASLSADNRFAYVCDLGLDQVIIYPFDSKTGQLNEAGKIIYKTAPGAGPRHFSLVPHNHQAVLINELDSTLSLLSADPFAGLLVEQSTLSTLPSGFNGHNTCADVHVHPSGRFVYGSNRGHDSIALFTLDPSGFGLKPGGHFPTGGTTPRNFAIDPTGAFLLAANQNSGSISVFRIDQKSGELNQTGAIAGLHSPVCINF
jgi:6-phosphogluconolactonase